MPPTGQQPVPPRSSRALLLVALAAGAVAALEMIAGAPLERAHLAALEQDPELSWAARDFAAAGGRAATPPANGRTRIAYLSNSHALTGGRVSRHLQRLLDRLCPGRVEIVDLSSAGMFAPEYLQRFAAALEHGIAAVILPVSYISFSDRMPLRRQSLSAQSMFHPAVLPRLPAGFWLRNWDIGLYTDALVARTLRVYRHRNAARDTWERPLATWLRSVHAVPVVRFMEVDERQGWRFPDGFDENLFDWRLYQGDRDRHVADMAALVHLAHASGVNVLASNLPIHWSKEPRAHDPRDDAAYRAIMRGLFAAALDYVDHADGFPKAFTTYDALHPTWHGARLHAFDLALRLSAHGVLPCAPAGEETILAAFLATDPAPGEAFLAALGGTRESAAPVGFRRLDVTEPANAADLLARVRARPIVAEQTRELVMQLALRIRYWRQTDFRAPEGGDWTRGVRAAAFTAERERARSRVGQFAGALADALAPELAHFPIPAVNASALVAERIATTAQGREIRTRQYAPSRGRQVFVSHDVASGAAISVIVRDDVDAVFYERTDVLGDGSFLEVHLTPRAVHVPVWVIQPDPLAGFGV